jgi:hypothetical protein
VLHGLLHAVSPRDFGSPALSHPDVLLQRDLQLQLGPLQGNLRFCKTIGSFTGEVVGGISAALRGRNLLEGSCQTPFRLNVNRVYVVCGDRCTSIRVRFLCEPDERDLGETQGVVDIRGVAFLPMGSCFLGRFGGVAGMNR